MWKKVNPTLSLFQLKQRVVEFAPKIKSDSPLGGTELMGVKIQQGLPRAVAAFDTIRMVSFVLQYTQKCCHVLWSSVM